MVGQAGIDCGANQQKEEQEANDASDYTTHNLERSYWDLHIVRLSLVSQQSTSLFTRRLRCLDTSIMNVKNMH